LTTGDTAPEIRVFDLGGHFRDAYQNLRGRLRSERVDLARRQGLAQFMAGVSAWAITGAALVGMVSRALRGAISLGDLALFYQAFQQGLSLGRTLLENVGQLYQNSLFLGNLFEFLDLKPLVISPERAATPPVRLREGIRFHNVTFRYPGTRKIALQDFNLTIPAGRMLAIVGTNGAGKSTLVKLLCRFYDPECGRVTLDGTDLRDFSVEELRRRITVLFQQPVQYNATVRDNIRMGDLKHAPLDEEIRSAARKAGAEDFIHSLPDGYDNLLGHWFEKGAQLSVGEWQRLGLARAFVREAPIILLDEPTSAMDPWAEAEWLGRLRRGAEGRTVVLITHRFTTAMVADEIHVMDQGRIVESGSHSELIDHHGRYSEWWAMQNCQ
jgi:ATP-binding cassette subfamily B protein